VRDVVIIGGGLSGLAAAYELEQLKVPYRLIEVKRRLGGTLGSEAADGFTLDSGTMAFPLTGDWSFLEALGLVDALCPAEDTHRSPLVAFKGGAGALVDALARRLTGTVIHRMAVSSLGELDGQFTLCMENGLMLDAAALVVAAPARHAERMFRTLAPEFALRLLDYGYDTITRVSLAYRKADLPLPPAVPWDMGIAFDSWTEDPSRVPPGGLLLQLGVRYPLGQPAPDVLLASLETVLKPAGKPVVWRSTYWAEADPLPPHQPDFAEKAAGLRALLPEGIAIAGSDYDGYSLAARFEGGRAAARRVAAYLQRKA
jgi:oxygen-dependent protoporphyrinogen oxidase